MVLILMVMLTKHIGSKWRDDANFFRIKRNTFKKYISTFTRFTVNELKTIKYRQFRLIEEPDMHWKRFELFHHSKDDKVLSR